MNAQQLQASQQIVRRNSRQRVWWLGLGLAIAAAAAIAFAIYEAPAKTALEQTVEVHLKTAVNAQSVRAHPNLPPTRRSSRVPAAHVDYVTAHSTGLSGRPSSAPSPTAEGQAVPDAATKGVLDYLRAHGVK